MLDIDRSIDTPPPALQAAPLRARALRYVLVDELMRYPERSIADLVTTVAARGYTLTGRASKTISDALRWEIRRGRVQRLGRGRYRYHHTSRSTARRIRRFAAICHRWATATRNRHPPPTIPQPDPTRYPRHRPPLPGFPPWTRLQWLWVT